MRRLFFLALIGIFVFACETKVNEGEVRGRAIFELNQKAWPKKIPINYKIKSRLENWMEFTVLALSFDALENVNNPQDLTLVIDDLIEKQEALGKSEFPKDLDVPQVRGRLTVFKTFLLKAHSSLNYHKDVQESILEMIAAYNAFRNQFNIMAHNTLDTKMLVEQNP